MVLGAFQGLSNLRITTIPRVEVLTRPIVLNLRRAMGGQMVGGGLLPVELMDKAPSAAPFQLDKRTWTQKLADVQRDSHRDPKFGRYYREFFFDEKFAEDTLNVPLSWTPGHWVLAVVKANEGGSSGVAVADN
jgi:hypothetical protein